MASKAAIMESPQNRSMGPPEGPEGPSPLRTDDLSAGRVIGLASACLVLLGGLILGLNIAGRSTLLGPGWASLGLVLGLAGLLFHASTDREREFRLIYLFGGWALLGVGVFVSLLPYPKAMGDMFGLGFLLMFLGLLFQIAPLRNEDDPFMRRLAQGILGGVGGVLALYSLIGGFWFADAASHDYLLPYGLLLALLGLGYLVACVVAKGIHDDLSYRIALGIGGLGVLVFVLALLRSMWPAVFRSGSSNFLLPWGLLLMGLGLVYVIVAQFLCSDMKLIVMTRRELGAFFFSPIAYLVIFGFTIANWFEYYQMAGLMAVLSFRNVSVPEPIVQHFIYSFIFVVCTIFVVPAITMRLLSEESRTGTLEVMLTAPIDEVHVVLSKFLAALTLFLVVWAPLGLLLIALRILGGKPFDYQPLMSFGIALIITGANFVSMGLFFSSLSKNQIVSAVLTFAGMLGFTVFHFMIGQPNQSTGTRTVLEHMSYLDLWRDAAQGRLLPRYLLFHASMAVLWLFLTVKVLESRKWK
jgi:ABC-type transport system involved in multi-copper enzyme maturation permease subunit